MIDALLQRARSTIRTMAAYSSARSIATEGAVFLDANESPDLAGATGLNRYPAPQPPVLRALLAAHYDVAPEQLFIGRGTDEAIDTLVRTFCEARQDAILLCPPTYGMYAIAAQLQDAATVTVPLRADFSLDVERVLAAITPALKIIFLCSPNNPTGSLIPWRDIHTICAATASTALVVVDEAYIEFTDTPSCTMHLAQHPNLVVLRTLSKAWGLAGARCGVAIAHPQIVALLQKVRAPYPISLPSQQAVCAALAEDRRANQVDRTSALLVEREWLAEQLLMLPTVKHVYSSAANFLLVRVADAARMVAHCRARGIIIRDRSSEAGLANHVRITIGTRDEHTQLLAALRELESA